jgi:hypothetical protein
MPAATPHQPPGKRRGPVTRGALPKRYGSPFLVRARQNDATRSPSLRCPLLLDQPTEAALFGVMRSHASRRAIRLRRSWGRRAVRLVPRPARLAWWSQTAARPSPARGPPPGSRGRPWPGTRRRAPESRS